MMDEYEHSRAIPHLLFSAYANKNPHHIAVSVDRQFITYSELNKKANQLAHYLQRFNFGSETVIAIAMERSIELIIAFLAVLKAGCAYLPLDENGPIERQAFILEDSKSALLITQSSLDSKFDFYSGDKILFDGILQELSACPTQDTLARYNANHLVYVIYTSGSTGRSKGVLIEHKSLLNYIEWLQEYSGISQQERIDFSSNFSFDLAVTTSIAALALGLHIVVCKDKIKKNIKEYLQYLQANKINIIKITPSYFKLMVEHIKNETMSFPFLKSIILGGENLPATDCQDWLAIYPEHILFNEYGPTEATVGATQYTLTNKNVNIKEEAVPIGKSGKNIECILLDEQKQPVTQGELYISGMSLARAYLNQPELTAKQFIHMNGKRWYKTGDFCQLTREGNFKFTGRIDDQVKIRGYKIEPREIEINLLSHAKIKDAVVIARKTAFDENKLIAYYISKHNEDIDKNNLREHLGQRIPDYMVPSNFVRVQAFPLTANGKLDKKLLPDPVITEEQKSGASSTRLEKRLAYIWRKVFHLEKIGMNADFYELGGNSLIAARIIAGVERYLKKKINLEDIYKANTIKKLAIVVQSAEKVKRPLLRKRILPSSSIIPLGDFQFLFWISDLFAPEIKNLNIVSRKRLAGRIDAEMLTDALRSLFSRHEVLRYHVSTIFPMQKLLKKINFTLYEKDLSLLSAEEKERELSRSLDELIHFFPWNKLKPLLVTRLFYLNEQSCELQISASHRIFDDASDEIFFSELSEIYLGKNDEVERKKIQYKNYIFYEKEHLNKNIKKDMDFWKTYFNDTHLIRLSSDHIIPYDKEDFYSTYVELPGGMFKTIQTLCKQYHVSIIDVVCASITLALQDCAGHLNKDKIFINIVKSTRDNEMFEKTLGCFLRLDPIKVDINTSLNGIQLAKYIQQSRFETESHQVCSGMLKLACLEKTSRKHFIRNALTYTAACFYSIIFKKFRLNPSLLLMYGRLKSLMKKQEFLINVNVLNNFISPSVEQLFGMKVMPAPTHQSDLYNVKNVLNICLLKNESTRQSYLVISGNLTKSFREKLGSNIAKHMLSNVSEDETVI